MNLHNRTMKWVLILSIRHEYNVFSRFFSDGVWRLEGLNGWKWYDSMEEYSFFHSLVNLERENDRIFNRKESPWEDLISAVLSRIAKWACATKELSKIKIYRCHFAKLGTLLEDRYLKEEEDSILVFSTMWSLKIQHWCSSRRKTGFNWHWRCSKNSWGESFVYVLYTCGDQRLQWSGSSCNPKSFSYFSYLISSLSYCGEWFG